MTVKSSSAGTDDEELLKEVTVTMPADLELTTLDTDSEHSGNSSSEQQGSGTAEMLCGSLEPTEEAGNESIAGSPDQCLHQVCTAVAVTTCTKTSCKAQIRNSLVSYKLKLKGESSGLGLYGEIQGRAGFSSESKEHDSIDKTRCGGHLCGF